MQNEKNMENKMNKCVPKNSQINLSAQEFEQLELSCKAFVQQGFDKDGSRKPVKSRLCRQQADGAFIKNEYEDRKRRIFEICVFFYWAFCFTLKHQQTTTNAIEWTSIDGVFLLSGKEQKNGSNT